MIRTLLSLTECPQNVVVRAVRIRFEDRRVAHHVEVVDTEGTAVCVREAHSERDAITRCDAIAAVLQQA